MIKKNLLVALGVFIITVVGLLVFSQTSKEASDQASEHSSIEAPHSHKGLTLNQ